MSHKQFTVIALLTLSTVLLPWSSMAWDDAGHEIVAQIAYDTLAKESPATKQKLDDTPELATWFCPPSFPIFEGSNADRQPVNKGFTRQFQAQPCLPQQLSKRLDV